MDKTKVACFDLDGTLTVRDAVVPFMWRVAGPARFIAKAGRNSISLSRAFVARDRDRAKMIASEAIFTGVSLDRIESLGQQMASRIAGGWMREDVLARLRWHQEAGYVTAIASASFSAYVRPLGELLGVDHVVATDLEFSPEGFCTGQLVAGNCRGEEKARRVAELVGDNELSFAYGDTAGDRPMLAMAVNGVFVAKTELQRVPEVFQ